MCLPSTREGEPVGLPGQLKQMVVLHELNLFLVEYSKLGGRIETDQSADRKVIGSLAWRRAPNSRSHGLQRISTRVSI